MMASSNVSLLEDYQKGVRPYLDLIDKLRDLGLEKELCLPAVCVIGDQSSGKSSILEALSGIQLPRGQDVVTRCPLRVQCKRVSTAWSATLVCKDKPKRISAPNDLKDQILKAQNKVAGEGKNISSEAITLRVESSSVPDLTLIDLPGITRVPSGNQQQDVYCCVVDVIKKAIDQPNVLILCVIQSDVDIATSEALKLAREVDPGLQRTMGVLTKMDLITSSTSRKEICQVLNNEKIPLKLGFRAVRCRTPEELASGIASADILRLECNLFKINSEYSALQQDKLGVTNLSRCLTKHLIDLIKKSLPDIRYNAQLLYNNTLKELTRLPQQPLDTSEDKERYFFKVRLDFLNKVKDDLFVGESNSITSDIASLSMAESGDCDEDETVSNFSVWRENFITFQKTIDNKLGASMKLGHLSTQNLKEKLPKCRGRQLPYFQNYNMFERLVQECIEQYRVPTHDCADKMVCHLQTLIKHEINEFFGAVPFLAQFLQLECEKSINDQSRILKEQLDFILKMEKLVFTQDQYYEEMCSQQKSKINDATDDTTQMSALIECFMKISNRRLSDVVPNCIRVCLHHDYYDRLSSMLAFPTLDNPTGGEGSVSIRQLIEESGEIVIKRKELRERIAILKKAIDELNK